MSKISQKNKVLYWLKCKGGLTTREAVIELGIMSLPRRIMELRDEGYPIELTYKKSANGARYGVYTLTETEGTV